MMGLRRLRERKRRPGDGWRMVGTTLTVLFALLWLVPLIFSILMSVRPTRSSIINGNIFVACDLEEEPPGPTVGVGPCWFTGDNYEGAWEVAPWPTHYANSILFVSGTLLVQIPTTTMAGYAFARMQFRGRSLLLGLVLLQIMIPSGILIIQNFSMIRQLGVFDTQLALMLPYWGSAFGVLLLRQTFRGVPLELEEAARMDGANWLQLMRHVYVPLSIPAYISFALISISSHWNEFLWPFIVTRSESVRPLTVGLNKLFHTTDLGANYNQMMAGTLIVIAPLVLVFLLFQRRFLESFAQSGLK